MNLIIHNPGDFELEVVTTFGASVKQTDTAIGFFGTGLKYAIATLLRAGASIRLITGGGEFVFHTKTKQVRGVDFQNVWMNDLQLAYTTELGRNWQPWMAIREIYSNAMDEGGGFINSVPRDGTTFEIKELDVDLTPYFIRLQPNDVLHDTGEVSVRVNPANWVYYQGFAAFKLKKESRLTYNITKKMALSEDRMMSDYNMVSDMCRDALVAARNHEYLMDALFHSTWEAMDFKWGSQSTTEFDWVYETILPYKHKLQNADLAYRIDERARTRYVRRYEARDTSQRGKLEAVMKVMKSMGMDFTGFEIVFSDEDPPGGIIAIPTSYTDYSDIIEFLVDHQIENLGQEDAKGLLVQLIEKRCP